MSLQEAKRGVGESFVAESKAGLSSVRRGLNVAARTAGASKTIEVEVDKPLGLTLGQKSGGGVVITVSPKTPNLYISTNVFQFHHAKYNKNG